MDSLVKLAQELTKNIRSQQAKSEREVEYYRGAADGITLLVEKVNEQETSQDTTAPLKVSDSPEVE